jgi:hypothetical protein
MPVTVAVNSFAYMHVVAQKRVSFCLLLGIFKRERNLDAFVSRRQDTSEVEVTINIETKAVNTTKLLAFIKATRFDPRASSSG